MIHECFKARIRQVSISDLPSIFTLMPLGFKVMKNHKMEFETEYVIS